MRVWRITNDNTLEDAAVKPGNLVFLFAPESRPATCPLGPPPGDADYLVRDASGWYYATDSVFGLKYASDHPMAGQRLPYGFRDR